MKRMNSLFRKIIGLFFVLQCFTLLYAQEFPLDDLKSGDLVFISSKGEMLSGAINRVTQVHEHENYDHVALVSKEGNDVNFLHATFKKGSVQQKAADFLQSYKDRRITVYRLLDVQPEVIKDGILEAKKMLGRPYNTTYVLSDSSYYCSDYIERAFRKYKLFNLEPMTFKDPKTGETDKFWESYYQKQGIPVPEGELGCNPNGLARSQVLRFMGELKR